MKLTELLYFQKGFNYSQDGPGNRLIYHLQGCNMHCGWCSNPEGMSIYGKCNRASVDEIVDEIISCRPMFFDRGGVTFTGGEASLQLNAVKIIAERVKKLGVSVAIETNGANERLPYLVENIDYIMMDFKHPDSEIHKKFTGLPNETVKRNITELSGLTTVHIRIPLIHGFNDDRKALKGFITFFKGLMSVGGKFDVELLSYHEYGKEKWLKLGKEYTVRDGFVTDSFVSDFEELLRSNNIKVIKT